MKKIILNIIIAIFLTVQTAFATTVNEDAMLINNIGRELLKSNHLPNADFIITDKPDTFDDYFVKASFYKQVEMFNWELSFAKDKEELAAVIAHQIGKISNNMPTQARSQSKSNGIVLTDKSGHEIMSYESKHIYSYEKLNKAKVDLAADRTAIDFLIQGRHNPLAFISIYGRYLDYDEEDATKHLMNVYDYINYNFPEKLKAGYPTQTYKNGMAAINKQLSLRTEEDKQKVKAEQAKIKEKKLKQANSVFKGMNPWNSSYTTLLLHK